LLRTPVSSLKVLLTLVTKSPKVQLALSQPPLAAGEPPLPSQASTWKLPSCDSVSPILAASVP